MRTTFFIAMFSIGLLACFPAAPEPPGSSTNFSFDAAVYLQDIQPLMDSSCSLGGCHDIAATVQAGFGLYREPAAGSEELDYNFGEVTARSEAATAEETTMYKKSTDGHGINLTEPETLSSWIADGLGLGGGGGGGNACVYSTDGTSDGYPFDLATYASDILPPLQGSCSLGAGCHGPGTAYNLTVYVDTDDTECADIETFNEVFRLLDYQGDPGSSVLIGAINGTLATHPVQPPDADELVAALTAFAEAAKTTADSGAE